MLTETTSISAAAFEQIMLHELIERFWPNTITVQKTVDQIPTFWVDRVIVHDVLKHLRSSATWPFQVLYDLTAVDERLRVHREGLPPSDFTVVYHLVSFERNDDVRIKVPLKEGALEVPCNRSTL